MKMRIYFISTLFVFLYLALISNIYRLQITKGDDYALKAEAQSRSSGFLEAQRGNIYFTDKYGNLVPAAMNKEYYIIFAVPKEIYASGEEAATQAAEQVALTLALDKERVTAKFLNDTNQYFELMKKATQDQVDAVNKLKIKGIYIDKQNFRFYPFEDVAAQILGFVSPSADDGSVVGKYGVELYANEELAGKDGKLQDNKVVEPERGENVALTIDSAIQVRAEAALGDLVEKYNAESGAVIIQEPKTGKILAMDSYPTFDPNNYSNFKIKDFLNPIVQSIYEPGSVFKVLTMAAGLDAGKLTPETTYYDEGFIKLNGYTIKNWDAKEKGAHGLTTMTEVIENSLNTGAAYAQQLMGKDLFYNYLVKFGFNEKTGIELPGEVSSNIKKLKTTNSAVDFATASFGQGIAVTPLAMITSFSAIANGGNLMKPFIMSDTKPQVVRRVISAEASKKTVQMMVSAVDKNVVAHIPGYYVAAKTGTAQIPTAGGYLANQFINTYIGFAPAYNPKFVILIRIDKPEGGLLAGQTVVPVFKDLAEFLINYYNLPPDYIEK